MSESLGIPLQPIEKTLGEQFLSHYWILTCWVGKWIVLVETCSTSPVYYLGWAELQLHHSSGYRWTEPTCSDATGCICVASSLITSVPQSFDGSGWCHLISLTEELCDYLLGKKWTREDQDCLPAQCCSERQVSVERVCEVTKNAFKLFPKVNQCLSEWALVKNENVHPRNPSADHVFY